MVKPLSPRKRGAIIYAHKYGDSSRVIAKRLGCGKTAVNDIIKLFHDTCTTTPGKRPGRPPILDTPKRAQLKTLVKNNRRLGTVKIKNLWEARTEEQITTVTLRRTLKKVGLKSCIPRKKPLISEVNRKKRLEFALAHKHWKPRHWRKVLFSDETTITQFQQNVCRVWREPEEEYDTSCLAATVKRSPGRMFWGCFSYQGLGPLIPLRSSVTGLTHAEVLRRYAIPTLRKFFPQNDGILQEDNARPHTSKVAAAVRESANVKTLIWPAQSPDLNPIENLWHEMKHAIRRRDPAPSSLLQLEKYVKSAWKDIPPEYYRKLIDSMPNRINAVIAAKGNSTKY